MRNAGKHGGQFWTAVRNTTPLALSTAPLSLKAGGEASRNVYVKKHSPLKPDTNTTKETLHSSICGLPYLCTPTTNVTHVYLVVGDALDYSGVLQELTDVISIIYKEFQQTRRKKTTALNYNPKRVPFSVNTNTLTEKETQRLAKHIKGWSPGI